MYGGKTTVYLYSIIQGGEKYTSDFIFYRKFTLFNGVDGGVQLLCAIVSLAIPTAQMRCVVCVAFSGLAVA